jgi:hypothetical protein
MWEPVVMYDAPQVLSIVGGMTVGGFSGTGMALGEPRDDQVAWLPRDCCSFDVSDRGLTIGRIDAFRTEKG